MYDTQRAYTELRLTQQLFSIVEIEFENMKNMPVRGMIWSTTGDNFIIGHEPSTGTTTFTKHTYDGIESIRFME